MTLAQHQLRKPSSYTNSEVSQDHASRDYISVSDRGKCIINIIIMIIDICVGSEM